MFAKNGKRWDKRATLLMSAVGAANLVGRRDDSYYFGAHPRTRASLPKVPGDIGCPHEARVGEETPRRPPLGCSPPAKARFFVENEAK